MSDQNPALDTLWNFGNPGESEQKFRTLLESLGVDADPAYRVETMTQLARSLGLQRKFEPAHVVLDEAVDLLAESMRRATVRCLLERGRVYNSSGSSDKAKPFFLDAWNLAKACSEDALAVDAAHMVAIVEVPEKQMQWNLLALAHAESSTDPKAQRWKGSLYHNIGWTYHSANQYDRALASFQKALSCRLEQGNAVQIRIGRWAVARALRSLRRYDEALEIQQSILSELENEQGQDAYVDEELGECLLALDRQDEARAYFVKAVEAMSSPNWDDPIAPERLERLRSLTSSSLR